jgi:phenylpyruvate tautomerase PptA (4-oxalocrotonate tautomerase family)
MPSTTIDVCREYSPAEESAIIDAVHDALVAAFKIPARDKHVRLAVHEQHRLVGSPDLERPERYTLVTVDCFAGRSVDAKRSLYRQIVDGLARFEIPADHISVLVRESPRENWGIRGGQAACDVDLGFVVEV